MQLSQEVEDGAMSDEGAIMGGQMGDEHGMEGGEGRGGVVVSAFAGE